MPAMILAAGRGERMRPLTDHTPKPLLQVGGKPLLQWHLEALAKAGFASVVINVAHLGSQIEQFVGDARQWGLKARFSREPEGALETAGGIVQATPWAEAKNKDLFLVINADIWTDWPRDHAFEIARHMLASGALAHLVLVDNPPHNPHGDFEFQAMPGKACGSPQPTTGPHHEMGLPSLRGATAPVATQRSLTFSGIGLYRPAFFRDITPGHRAPLAPLLRQAIALGHCTASHYRGKWSDIGTPERLSQLNTQISESS
jgi:N-acetyl-alpha-D-muramate 1-phosphate uridylyltransferase